MRPQRCGVKWRLSVACTALVVGGFAANWAALHDRTSIAESAAVQPGVAAAPQPLLATPQPLPATPQPLREIDQAPPPLAPAVAESPLQPTLQAASPAGRMTILLLGIDQRPD